MKILAISDFFPPHYVGGYELACADVMTRLAARGHDVRVLTSDYHAHLTEDAAESLPVSRTLKYMSSPEPQDPREAWRVSIGECVRQCSASRTVVDAVERFDPDIVSVWHLWAVSPSVFQTCLRLKTKVVFAISDYWVLDSLNIPLPSWYQYWKALPESGVKRAAKIGLRTAVDRWGAPTEFHLGPIAHSHFFSEYLRDEYVKGGADIQDGVVIYHGIDLAQYRRDRTDRSLKGRLLYVGRLSAEKGVDVAIRAIAALMERDPHSAVELHLVGGGDKNYVDTLKALASDLGIGTRVLFLGMMSRNESAAMYPRYDALLFTSTWPEPFSIVLIEALASGIPVIGTTTGGSREILVDGVNALVTRPNDPVQLADKIELLLSDAELRGSLSASARKSVENMCDVHAIVERIERYYTSVVQGRPWG